MLSIMARRCPTPLTLSAIAAIAAATANAGSITSVPIRLHGTEAPVVVIRVQGQELPLQLDLGDASSIVLHPEVLGSLRTEPTADTFRGFSMDGKIETPIVRLDLVEVGDIDMFGVAARADAHDDAFRSYKKSEIGAVGFVGMGLFKSGQLVVDYSRSGCRFLSLTDRGRFVTSVAGNRFRSLRAVRGVSRRPSAPTLASCCSFGTPVALLS